MINNNDYKEKGFPLFKIEQMRNGNFYFSIENNGSYIGFVENVKRTVSPLKNICGLTVRFTFESQGLGAKITND